MRCPKCGAQMTEADEQDGRCSSCGYKLSGPMSPPPRRGVVGNAFQQFFTGLGRLLGLVGNMAPGQSRHQETGQFLPVKGTSGKQTTAAATSGHAEGQPQEGEDDAPQTPDDVLEAEAEKRGLTLEELKDQLGISDPEEGEEQDKGKSTHNAELVVNPPSWVTDEAAWDRAKELASKGDYDDESYYAVVTTIYQNITGSSGYKGAKQLARKYGGANNSLADLGIDSPDGKPTTIEQRHGLSAKADRARLMSSRAQQATYKAEDDEKHGAAHKAHLDAAKAHEEAAKAAKEGQGENSPGLDYGAATFHEGQAKFHREHAAQHLVKSGKPGGYKLLDNSVLEVLANESLVVNALFGQENPMMPDNNPHDMSKRAVAASVMTGHGKARQRALAAMDHSNDGNHEDAADLHTKAAGFHDRAATQSRRDGDVGAADDHEMAASMHRKAASMHLAYGDAVTNAEREVATANEFESDEQRNAFFGLLKAKGGDSAKVAGKSEDANALSEKANFRSKAAGKAGGEERRAKEHGKAAEAHKEAGKAHWDAMKKATDKGDKEKHQAAAKEHFAKAKEHEAKASPSTNSNRSRQMPFNRDTTIDFLVTNCSCWENARDQLSAMSDGQLAFLARNAKTDGSNSDDANTSGYVDAGGEEEGGEGAENDEDWNEETERKVPRKKNPPKATPTGNRGRMIPVEEWLQAAPPPIRDAVTNAMEIEQREKAGIVNRLVANIGDKSERQGYAQKLMRQPLKELREMLKMLPPAPPRPRASGFPWLQGEPEPLHIGAVGATTNQLSQDEKNDFLPLPEMDYSEDAK